MKSPMLADDDAFALEEQSDVHAHAEPELARSSRTRLPPPPPPPGAAAWQRLPPPPPPPPWAAAQARSRRSLWFVPSLAAVMSVSVVGVIALIRMGPASARDEGARIVPIATAAAPSETTQISAAQDPAEPPGGQRVAVADARCAQAAEPAAAADSDIPEETEAADAPSYAYHARPHRGMLLLKSNVPSAVYVDGRKLGNSSRHAFSLPPGKYDVALENAVTNQRTKFSVVLAAGSVIERRVRLARTRQ